MGSHYSGFSIRIIVRLPVCTLSAILCLYTVQRRSHDLKLGGDWTDDRPKAPSAAQSAAGEGRPELGVLWYHPWEIFQIHHQNLRIVVHICGCI